MAKKLNILLAVTEHLGNQFKALVTDYKDFFKSKQEAFRGEKKTYIAVPDSIDIAANRYNKLVQTTVKEKLAYMEENVSEYIDALFSQEATNASGKPRAELIVDGKSWGTFSSLELLRLKSLLESKDLVEMYSLLPVRSDAEIWVKCTDDQYTNRDMFQTERSDYQQSTTTKESYIMLDPNVGTGGAKEYKPQIGSKDTKVILGNGTFQKFSGETSHRERAELLARRTKLLSGVIVALKEANEAEVVESQLTAKKIFDYLHF